MKILIKNKQIKLCDKINYYKISKDLENLLR